jgi:ABC-type lipopolysaccharide export system ATPase subunit
MAETLLKVENLQAWYGESHILHGVGFEIGRGELVTLLGRNGAGKTTTLKSVMGIVEKRTGSVTFEGKQTVGQPSDTIARLGLAYSTSRPKAWRRSSSSASARSSASSRAAASPSCWSSRTSISPPPWPTAITSWRTATSSTS